MSALSRLLRAAHWMSVRFSRAFWIARVHVHLAAFGGGPVRGDDAEGPGRRRSPGRWPLQGVLGLGQGFSATITPSSRLATSDSRLHDVEGGHGPDLHPDLVLVEELLREGQALAGGREVVDGVDQVVVEPLHVRHRVDHGLAELDVGDLRLFFATRICVRDASVLRFLRRGWLSRRFRLEAKDGL